VAPELPAGPRLALLAEAKITDLLGDSPTGRFEASGVVVKDGVSYVVFDDSPHIARIADFTTTTAGSALLKPEGDGHSGYEDIAHDPGTDRFFVLIEGLRRAKGFMAKVAEYDGAFNHVATDWLDFPLGGSNKGLEGLACRSRGGETYLLALCEGNRCRSGAAGRRPGGGRIQIFAKGRGEWEHTTTMRLPETAWFEDYSSVAVAGDRIAVVSQASAALWLGTLRHSAWELADEGLIYRFPGDVEGRTAYCTPEGVAWLTADRIVVVSDKAKPAQRRGCRAKDESIHLFAIPGLEATESEASGLADRGVNADSRD
jgi:hypothetical protein